MHIYVCGALSRGGGYSGVATRLPVQDLNRARLLRIEVGHLPGPTRKWDGRGRR